MQPTMQPEGAGQLQCVALWDLESCPIPGAVLQHSMAGAIVQQIQQRFGTTKIIGSAGMPHLEQSVAAIKNFEGVHVLHYQKRVAAGPGGISRPYHQLNTVGRNLCALILHSIMRRHTGAMLNSKAYARWQASSCFRCICCRACALDDLDQTICIVLWSSAAQWVVTEYTG